MYTGLIRHLQIKAVNKQWQPKQLAIAEHPTCSENINSKAVMRRCVMASGRRGEAINEEVAGMI